MTGQYLESFDTLSQAETYCNSRPNCDGITDSSCDRGKYYPVDGTPESFDGDCSWVRNSYS